jgi:hypothetical protein
VIGFRKRKTPEVIASGVVISGRSFLELAHPLCRVKHHDGDRPMVEILKFDQERHQIDSVHDRIRGVHNAAPIRPQIQVPVRQRNQGGATVMAKQRRGLSSTKTKSTAGATPVRTTTGPQKMDSAKQRRVSQLLTVAAKRDLTDKELKALSVVQLAEYAKIRHNRPTRKKDVP